MDVDYNQLSAAVMSYIKENSCGKETVRVYTKCFQLLAEYLTENEVAYSAEEASSWLSNIDSQVNKTEFSLYTAAVNKLNDLVCYGEIRKGHYDQSKTIAGKLIPAFQQILSELSDYISSKAWDTRLARVRGCASILFRFQDSGIVSATSIQYETLVSEYFNSSGKTNYVKSAHHTSLRLLVQFLYSKDLVPFGFTLLVDAMAGPDPLFWNKVPEAQIYKFRSDADGNGCSLVRFLELRNAVYEEHCRENYSQTSLNYITRITNLFYLFLDMNKLTYYPAVGTAWLMSIKPFLKEYDYKHFRRILCLVERQYEGSSFPLSHAFVFRETNYQRLPDWCRPEVDSFLRIKSDEGWADSTVDMYKTSICRFCISMDSMGVRHFNCISVSEVKQFNLIDSHKTSAGKNAYNSRIRKFLEFLGENQSINNPFLYLALPSVCAPRETLVITLTEDEQATLRQCFRAEDSTITLREKAMIQLGLYMGIRETDIIGLTIDDIDWENASIRVLQDKTGYEVILPMPTTVANALFRYIMKERPVSDTRSIFIRKCAPFTPIGQGACRNALKTALPDRDVPGAGFHVARKTYATNLLRGGVPVQHVADALGHQGLGTVQRYLSLEEERMRLCALSLQDCGLLMEGGIHNG